MKKISNFRIEENLFKAFSNKVKNDYKYSSITHFLISKINEYMKG